MKKEKQKKIYISPAIERLHLKMEQSVAAGSAGSAQPGGGSGVQEEEWLNGGSETKDPSGEWWN